MKDAWFVALCAIAFFTIIEAKPWTRGSSHGNYADDSYGGYTNGRGVGYGSGSYGAGGIGAGGQWGDDHSGNGYGGNSYRSSGSSGKGKGGGGYGSGPRRGGWKRHSSEELDDWSYLKPYCSGPGCSIVSVGNGHHNTNIVDIVSK